MGACASTEGVEMGADVTGGGGGGGGVEAPSNWGDPSGPIRMHNVELLKDLVKYKPIVTCCSTSNKTIRAIILPKFFS